MKPKKLFFVSGIDTDIGKSIVTGVLAREWAAAGAHVVTQKFIQTGVPPGELSEDILTHRRIMGIDPLPEDRDGTTCPLIFTYPASPHLAAGLDGRRVNLALVARSSERLLERYDIVLLEGAGGLMVPLDGLYTTMDYIAAHRLPLILVTSPRLGSINHTLMSLELCRTRGVEVAAVVYNLFPAGSAEITADTRDYLRNYLARYHPGARWWEVDGELRFTGSLQ